MTMAGGVLVVAELARGKPITPVYELLALARTLLPHTGGEISAALLGHDVAETARDLIARGAERLYLADDAALAEYHADLWLPALTYVAQQAAPAAILVAHTNLGTDLAPRLAFRLGTAVATGCVEVVHDGHRLLATRPCYGGNVREVRSFRTAAVVATVRGGIHDAADRSIDRDGEVVAIEIDFNALSRRTRVTARERNPSDAVRLEDARVVIAGGRGLEGPEGFRLLEELARELDGAVGASRVPCDIGWCPHSMQIGLTGKTVTPELYIAVGISGAGHHMAGCGSARTIVAINTDIEAMIYKEARWGIVADYRQVIPPLIEAIRQLRSSTAKMM